MALYPTPFGHVDIPDPGARRPDERPSGVRLVRRPRPSAPAPRR